MDVTHLCFYIILTFYSNKKCFLDHFYIFSHFSSHLWGKKQIFAHPWALVSPDFRKCSIYGVAMFKETSLFIGLLVLSLTANKNNVLIVFYTFLHFVLHFSLHLWGSFGVLVHFQQFSNQFSPIFTFWRSYYHESLDFHTSTKPHFLTAIRQSLAPFRTIFRSFLGILRGF